MNCHEFRSHQFDLAASGSTAESAGPAVLKTAGLIEDALRHTADCAACAKLLAEQRALSARFQQLVSNDADCGPSPEQENSVRAAYRAIYKVDSRTAASSSIDSRRVWASAIAAMLLVTVASIALSEKISAWFADGSAAHTARVAVAEPMPIAEAAPVPPTSIVTKAQARSKAWQKSSEQVPENSSPAAIHTALRPDAQTFAQPIPEQISAEQGIIDFVPLPYDGDPMLAGSGPIVRVELNEAALRSLGLSLGFPIPAESSARKVQADLVLGQDGFARAIRFVP